MIIGVTTTSAYTINPLNSSRGEQHAYQSNLLPSAKISFRSSCEEAAIEHNQRRGPLIIMYICAHLEYACIYAYIYV